MKAIRVKPEEAVMGNDGRNEMLRSTLQNSGKFMLAFKPYRQEIAANDHITDLARSAA